jgi:enoyl-CoA hydratase/carnithine racemase
MERSGVTVTTNSDGHVFVVVLDRPEKRNALDAAHARALDAAFDEFDRDHELRVAVLTGTADCFCSGADIAARVAGQQIMNERGLAGFTHRERAKPVIAAVEGAAYGGGFELVLACDLVVAARDARFAMPEVTRGFVPAAGGAYRLSWALPGTTAMELLLTGDPLTAERAHSYGLVTRLSAPGAARETAVALACEIAGNAPLAVRSVRKVVRAARTMNDSEAMALLTAEYAALQQTRDYREGPRAFLEKRPPRWTGT